MATALSEEELDNEDYYSLLNVRREVRLAARRRLGGGRARWFGRAGLTATAPSPPRAAGTRRGGRVTPPDMRDRPPTGRSPPPRPRRRGLSRPASTPAPGGRGAASCQGQRAWYPQEGKGPRGGGYKSGVPGPPGPGASPGSQTCFGRGAVSSPPAGRMGN